MKNQLPGYPQSGWKAMSVKEEEERRSMLTMVSTNALTKINDYYSVYGLSHMIDNIVVVEQWHCLFTAWGKYTT